MEWSAPDRLDAVVRAPVAAVSVAGLAFQVEGSLNSFRPGCGIDGVSVRFGGCRIHGDLVVRNSNPLDDGRIEVGCLFYPTAKDEDRWMTLLTGIDIHPVDEDDE